MKGVYLFPGRGVGDRPIVKVNNAHTATLDRAELSHRTLYSLCHTWATRATEKGVDLVTLAAMLGHSRTSDGSQIFSPFRRTPSGGDEKDGCRGLERKGGHKRGHTRNFGLLAI